VFLTPDRDEPSDPKWTTLGYLKVLELLETLLQRNAIKIEVFQQSVIKQYMEVLRRHVVKEDTVLAKQARDLYQRHQRAFDFIFENKPSYATSLHEHLSRFISKRNKEVRLDHESPNYFRFVPLAWDKISSLKTKAGWNNGSLISCELTTPDSEDRKLDLHIVIHMQGPRPYLKLGRSIYESVEKQKLRSKNKFLFLRRRKIPVPSEFSDDFNEEVAREIASYIRDEVPRITAGIKKAVASR
jgi:hypothetical protein